MQMSTTSLLLQLHHVQIVTNRRHRPSSSPCLLLTSINIAELLQPTQFRSESDNTRNHLPCRRDTFNCITIADLFFNLSAPPTSVPRSNIIIVSPKCGKLALFKR